jgi:hypothetical protein
VGGAGGGPVQRLADARLERLDAAGVLLLGEIDRGLQALIGIDLLNQESLPAFERRVRRYTDPDVLILDELNREAFGGMGLLTLRNSRRSKGNSPESELSGLRRTPQSLRIGLRRTPGDQLVQQSECRAV